ncbi:simple sugar transport system permease protein/D-xylose transport system permease protein [Plantibacter flavus]|uniref:Xylose transport system permease protein XylH n=1 Tax=Plantibacter flavus TaxID=150123 RepID=A0A3N2BZ57_9MICO|nr:ABC transporter permease [Plantibacter flavus]ROR80502.1 simple sugar transport system permease protein/D-xylose transport system permease protein [Plantibacter flavus]SMG33838.1 simple sugar transport system permease protein/D-xylose transport system permease protein [Plantibacter flavus]
MDASTPPTAPADGGGPAALAGQPVVPASDTTSIIVPRSRLGRLRGGDLGALPVVIGLVVIWLVFQLLNPNFLSANNLVNLTLQCAAVGTIAIGIVLVLLLGQIDLSVGSVSGLAAAILGAGLTQAGWSLWLAIIVALVAGVLIGLLYGLLFTRFGVPSFVITLAGLLGFLGLQLLVLGPNGSINIPYDSPIVQFAQSWFLPPWLAYLLVALSGGSIIVSGVLRSRRRREAGLPAGALVSSVIRGAVVVVLGAVVVAYLATDRGVGAMFVLFVVLVMIMNFMLSRTKWGRSVYAVGGSVEAARRAGIRVNRIYISVFILCSTFAVVGGLLAAARLTSASLSSGGGDTNLNAIAAAVIGGTSLFGGRGSAWSALLGIIVIQSISNGLTLLNLDSSIRYMITGAVLLLAVIVDSLSRRSRQSHGQA